MKQIIILLFILSFNGLLIGQSTNFHITSLEYYIDNKVLIEGCDTASFSLTLNLSDEEFPLELSLSGTTDTLDYWTNLDTNAPIIINSSATHFPIQLFPEADTLAENGETLIFTFRKPDNSEIEFTLVFLDEAEQLSVTNSFEDVFCSESNWEGWGISMQIDSSFTDIPHEYMFLDYHQIHFSYASEWGCYVDEYDENSCPLPDTLKVEVHALNCVVGVVFAEVFDPSTVSIDTFTCQNEREMDFEIWSTSFISSEQEVRVQNANAFGCDSILNISTEFFPVQLEVEQIAKSPDDVYLFDNMPVTEFGNYEAHYVNEYGCDSSFFATIIPYSNLPLFNDIPNTITGYSGGCESRICLPLVYDRWNEFDYFIDDEILINPEFEFCEMSSTIYERNVSQLFTAGNEPRRIKDLKINDVEYPDVYCENIGEFIEVINYYNEDLKILGLSNSKLLAKTTLKLEFKEELLNTGYEISRFIEINDLRDSYLGTFIPMPVGIHELKIKHKYSPAEKTVTVNLEGHTFFEVEDLELDYFGELGQRVNFPLPANDLCSEIVSATEKCSNIPPSLADFTLSNQGLLSFKPLLLQNFSFCIEICDVYNNCQIVTLNVIFEGAEDYAIQRNLYPNPAQNTVVLTEEEKFNIEKVTVHDALGRQVEILFFEPESFVEMDISRYPEGVYFLTVHINGENYIHKLLIQR